jgi:hypothetical protein
VKAFVRELEVNLICVNRGVHLARLSLVLLMKVRPELWQARLKPNLVNPSNHRYILKHLYGSGSEPTCCN